MRSFLSAAALVGLASAVPYEIADYIQAAAGTPDRHPTFGKSSTSTSGAIEPCTQIATLQTQGSSTRLPADLALACLKSVPLDAEGGAVQLDGLKTFLQFQSTLAYLKDPPVGYLYGPTDILGGLDQIGELLQKNSYTNEYDFQLDIYKLIASAFDGHFQYQADILSVFFFTRDLILYSISTDGLSLPEIYLDSDVTRLLDPNGASGANSTVSPVAKINGVTVETWLNEYATLNGNNQDPDANYNNLFPIVPLNSQSIAIGNGGSQGAVSFSLFYQGNDTTVTFRNGITRHIKTDSFTRKNLTGVTDGKSFFDTFCTGPKQSNDTSGGGGGGGGVRVARAAPTATSTQVAFTAVATETSLPAPTAYPQPLVIAADYSIGGYFPEENPDLAVLSVPTFEPADNVEFQDVVREFLATSKKEGKKNLIIDLRGNGGGNILLGYDLFKQLFPTMDPFGGANFRAFPLFNDLGTIESDRWSNVTDASATRSDVQSDGYTSIFNVKSDLTDKNGAFGAWSDFFGPHEHHSDNFTSIVRWNLSDVYETVTTVSGFADLAGVVPVQTFNAENIVLVQDGNCASTCTIFSEFMKSQAHVKQVVFGGRKQAAAMQAVGGVKGANIYNFQLIADYVDEAWFTDATPEQQAYLNQTYGNVIPGMQQALKRAAINSAGELSASVNVRNNIRFGDDTVTPLQFVYEAADCRFFYTVNQIVDQTLVWDAAAQAAWGNTSCVKGSTNQPSSGLKAPELAAPPPEAGNFFGAKDASAFPADLVPVAKSPQPTASSLPSAPLNAAGTLAANGALVTVVFGFAASLLLL